MAVRRSAGPESGGRVAMCVEGSEGELSMLSGEWAGGSGEEKGGDGDG